MFVAWTRMVRTMRWREGSGARKGGNRAGRQMAHLGRAMWGAFGTAVVDRKQWGPQGWSLGCTYTLRSHKTHVLWEKTSCLGTVHRRQKGSAFRMGLRELSQFGGGTGLGRVQQESMGVSQHPSGDKEEELSIIPTATERWVWCG